MGGNEYRGVAPGSFRGLDLREDFYVGGVPDYNAISRASGYRQVQLKSFYTERKRLRFSLYFNIESVSKCQWVT